MSPKTILITGAGSGFGRDTAWLLASRGHKVIATTETEEQATEMQTVAKNKKLPLEAFKLDVSSELDRQKILTYKIDVLVNNAGRGESGSLAELPLERLRHDFEVNVFGSIALAQLALRQMMTRNKGTIVFVSSLAGQVAIPFLASYSMTKFALCGGVSVLREEILRVRSGVFVSLIEPGAYHTGFNQRNVARQFEWLDEKSYFFKIKDKIKQEMDDYFKTFEIKTTDSLVWKIVQACESPRPRARYSAPWWQDWGIYLLKIFGK